MNDIIVVNSLSYLSVKEVLLLSRVSKLWYTISKADIIWLPLVDKLWSDKVYIPEFSKSLLKVSAKLAYYSSLMDSKRTFITCKELTNKVWSFRFKEEAGDDWLDLCPWSHGFKASEIMFHPNSMLERLIYPIIEGYTFHTSTQDIELTWKLDMKSKSPRRLKNVKSFYSMLEKCGFDVTNNDDDDDEGRMLKFKSTNTDDGSSTISHTAKKSRSDHSDNSFNHNDSNTELPLSSPSYSLSSSPSSYSSSSFDESTIPISSNFSLPHDTFNPYGDLLVLSVNGIQVPKYHLSRSPTGNWGFIFESCWAVYTSFPLPKKGECLLLEDENLNMTVNKQYLEVKSYNEQMQTLLLLNGIQDE